MHPFYEGIDHKRTPGEDVSHYLARAWSHRHCPWDSKHNAYRFACDDYDREKASQERVERYVKLLPLWVPGLKVVRSELHKRFGGFVWFTWNREAMYARLREIYEEHGAADERLLYMTCSGKVELSKGQLRLPGVVEVEPRGRRTIVDWSGSGHLRAIESAYTGWGLKLIDSGFCNRIMHPNRGGPTAEWFSNRKCEVGNEWWLVGTRGDSPDVLSLEIQAAPLSDQVKENLLYNLENLRLAG